MQIAGAVMVMAVMAASSFLLTSAACITSESWWPMLAMAFTVMAPMPILCCGRMRFGNDRTWMDDDDTAGNDVLWFLSAALGTSGVLMPLVLAHNRIVSIRSIWMSMLGSWTAAATVSVFVIMLVRGKG